MNKYEYLIYGKVNDEKYEQILFSNNTILKNLNNGVTFEQMIEYCKNKGAKDVRLSRINMYEKPDFTQTINKR